MGRFDSGQIVSLFFLVPGLWSVFVFVSEVHWSELVFSCMLFAVITLNSELKVPTPMACLILASMLFWLMLLSYLVLFKSEKVKKRTGSRNKSQKVKRFRRKSCHSSLS